MAAQQQMYANNDNNGYLAVAANKSELLVSTTPKRQTLKNLRRHSWIKHAHLQVNVTIKEILMETERGSYTANWLLLFLVPPVMVPSNIQ